MTDEPTPKKRKKVKLDLELLDNSPDIPLSDEELGPPPTSPGEFLLTMRSRLLKRLGLRDDVEYDPDPFEDFYSQFDRKRNGASDGKEASLGD